MFNFRHIFRFRIQSIPFIVGFLLLLILVRRSQQNWQNLARLVEDRKYYDLVAISNGIEYIDRPPLKSKRDIQEAMAGVVRGAHRNTVFMLGESRYGPEIVVQPTNKFTDDEILKGQAVWANGSYYKQIYSKNGFTFKFQGKTFQAVARQIHLNKTTFELLSLTCISRSIGNIYHKSLLDLTLLLAAVAFIVLVVLSASSRAVVHYAKDISAKRKSIKRAWYPEEIRLAVDNYNNFLSSERLYKIQIEQSTSGQMIIRSRGLEEAIIHSANKAMETISGHTQAELKNQPLNLIVPKQFHHYHFGIGAFDPDLGRRVGMHAYASGCPFHGHQKSRLIGIDRTVDVIHKDGSTRKAVLGIYYVGKNDAGEDEWSGTFTDVTELTDAVAKAEEAKEENLRLTQAWSHDLKGHAKGVWDELSDLKRLGVTLKTDAEQVCFNAAIARAELTYNLIQNTRDLGDLELSLKLVSTNEIRDRIHLTHGSKNIKYKWPDQEYFVEIDIDRFISMGMNNLIENAFKYSTGTDPEVVLGLKIGEGFAKFFVQDFGLGMDEAGQAKVMAGNFGSRVRLNPQIPGTGQGIFSAQRVFKAHNAVLSLKSQLGQGSVFIVKIKLGGHLGQ